MSERRARERDRWGGGGERERSCEPRQVGNTGHRAVAQCGANSIFHFGQDRVEVQIFARTRHPLLVQRLRERKEGGCKYTRHPDSATLSLSRSPSLSLSLAPSPCPPTPLSLLTPTSLPSHSHAWRRKRAGRRRAVPDSIATLARVYTPPLVYWESGPAGPPRTPSPRFLLAPEKEIDRRGFRVWGLRFGV